ncbi:peptidoglycan-binding protein [Leifsonia shinshuensis]|uniref:peptidoglycan-binding domain-containing protein n=1 Tax=Leifsonia shinshuensis TaxID=150026 RepID=UPI001F50D2C4|nr:peptidoglycan-binding protein [Leifsonia shinshuensis]MCI0159178.1 peptidoglycan-binding protein [Leifsonia shinshuensis]
MIRRLLLPVATALAGLAAGVLVVSTFAPSAPDSLQVPQAPRTLGLQETEFRDERSMGLTADVDRTAAIALNTSGMVTASRCAPGAGFASGDVIAHLDAAPVVALSSSTPLFRDLALDDEGTDVTALRGALRGLGFAVDAEGSYSTAVRDAVKELQRRAGVAPADGVLRLSSIAWLPGPTVAVTSCEVIVGERYELGSPYAQVPGTLRSLTLVTGETTTVVPGDRILRLGAREFTMPDSGVIGDRAVLDTIAASPEYLANAAKPKDSPLSVTARLVTPLRVVAVPPGALVGTAADARCVQAENGATAAVRIVASRLGSSFVVFDGDVPKRIRIGAAVTARACG